MQVKYIAVIITHDKYMVLQPCSACFPGYPIPLNPHTVVTKQELLLLPLVVIWKRDVPRGSFPVGGTVWGGRWCSLAEEVHHWGQALRVHSSLFSSTSRVWLNM